MKLHALAIWFLPLVLVSAADSPKSDQAFRRPLSTDDQINHAAERLMFGPAPGDRERIRRQGVKKFVEAQLHPDKIHETPSLDGLLRPYDSTRMSIGEAYSRFPKPQAKDPITPQERQKLATSSVAERRQLMQSRNPQALIADDLIAAKLLRAIYSQRQLQELLVDFWYNHFNVFLNKGADHYLVPSFEREAIRPYVLGKFSDLLTTVAKSPAMLFYLDNWQSVAPDSPAAQRAKRKRGLNENYGRELLELHTLGVNGGYTQKDVIEVARCFTGWTITGPRRGDQFTFNPRAHDTGQKIVLGHTIAAGGGLNDGLAVLKILAHHPATAHFISLELAQRFVADDPPPALVNRMAQTFLKKDGDLRAVMKTMLLSREFWSAGAASSKVKTPFELVVSAVRATGADVQSTYGLANQVQKLGEPLYRKIEPTGYSNLNSEWVNSSGLLGRMNFALLLSKNKLNGITVPAEQQQMALQLGAPEFQKH